MAMSSDEAYYENGKQLKGRKGKSKICSLSRHARNKFHERLDFKFYDFQALEIEKGWNNLFLSIISTETGETIAKSGKALVQNGQCYWEDSMLSTIWISDDSLEDNEGLLLKLIVAMGSARFGTLGEATINLASYIRPEISTTSLPLQQHCSHGAILQHRKNATSYVEEMNVGYDDVDNISDVSDNTFSRTSGSSHCEQLENTYYKGELSSKRISPLATCSDHGVDSLESSFSFWIEKFPQQSNVSGLKNTNDRQDSAYSRNCPNSLHDTSRSIHSSSVTSSFGTQLQDKMDDFGKASHASDTTLTRSVSSSKDLLGVAQATIELLHGEAKMWEESARKLMIDVERLRNDLNKKSKNKKELEMELSASYKESDVLKDEIQRLTTMVKKNDSRYLKFQIEEMDNTIKELKDEIKYQKRLNCDLELKLKKTQESNIDLVSILQKLEKTIRKQKMEIADLSMRSLQFQDAENNSRGLEETEEEDFSLSVEVLGEKMKKELCNSDVDLGTNENAIRCLHEGIELQEFRNLELELQFMQEKQKNMESAIQFLEKTLAEKDQEMQTERLCMAQTMEENEEKWRNKLFKKGKQIINFEKRLSDGVYAFSNEILALTERVQDLEAELCENHGESRKDLIFSGSFSSNFPLFASDTAVNITEVFLELYKQIQLSVENLRGQDSLLGQVTFTKNKSCFSISELSKDIGKIDLKELTEAILYSIVLLRKLLETKTNCFEYEINSCNELVRRNVRDDNTFQNEVRDFSLEENIFCISSQELRSMHAKLVSEFTPPTNYQVQSAEANKLKSYKKLGKEKACPKYSKLEQKTEVASLPSKISSNCSTDFPHDSDFHDWTKDSQTLVYNDHVSNLSVLESSDDGHNALFGIETENVQLYERISDLEAEMRHLIEEKESTHLALENSENVVINLQAEIGRLETSNEAQKVELKRKEESMEKKWMETQEECSILKLANLEIQATNENLIKESKTLQATNDELRMQNLELHSQCTVLESKLGESQLAFSDMLKLVEDLEYKFTLILDEIALKEKIINVDLDSLLQEIKKQDERFIMEEKFLTQMYSEKTAEVGNLQRKVEHLRDQMSGICDRHARMASNIILEVYDLYADKAMLEASLQEEWEKVKLYETKLNNLRAENEAMVQNFTLELASTRENHETLMNNHEQVVVSLENVKSNEEKLKGMVRGLKVQLKASELERLQAKEEISEIEVQLQKTEMLQNEIFILKRSLYEAEFEYRKLEASYQTVSLECDELKAKQISYIQRIQMTAKVTSELEDCKLTKIELEEKILRLQWDLTTKEASCSNNAQLKYELAQMTKENSELYRKKDSLQQENEDYKNRVKALEENPKLKKGVKQDQYHAKDCTSSTPFLHDLKFLQETDRCAVWEYLHNYNL
ncbi:synaptonemal complex protein 1-like [Abrus precatorius]|uniref:Synaptonemal complex protein 1-like n=1 Tax=Abrus precatorius TaxID=3816 RepID=A0A8B8M7Z4_ABRPR|nr:synaptonemal complex protein 1-like [Abrus precatorius]